MLDSVIINIPTSSYRIHKPSMFTPNALILKGQGNYLVKCVNNPTADDKKKGIYKPRLTLIKRMTKNGDAMPLKVEFSVAKMIYGNNVDEVQEGDFEHIVNALRDAMYEMGVSATREGVNDAPISAFHPSKNIELKSGYTSRFVITELEKIDVSKKMDLNRDSFRNSGHSLQFYTNSHSLVIYDKVKDLKKPEKRAIDKDQNSIQRSLFDVLAKQKEIIRIEARLAKKVKLNAVLKELGFKQNPTFKDIFNKNLCQKILRNYWETLIANKNLFLFDMENNPKRTLEKVFKSKPKIKPKEAIYIVGLRYLSKEGIRDTRSIIEEYATPHTWHRLAKDLAFLDDISDKVYHGWVRQIDDSLSTFMPFKLSK